MTRTLTCDRCHKDTDHLNPVYDDSGERSVILDWCDECVKADAWHCDICGARVPFDQILRDNALYRYVCLACRRPAPTDEGARLRNAMREAVSTIVKSGRHSCDPKGCEACRAAFILSNALEGDADNANP